MCLIRKRLLAFGLARERGRLLVYCWELGTIPCRGLWHVSLVRSQGHLKIYACKLPRKSTSPEPIMRYGLNMNYFRDRTARFTCLLLGIGVLALAGAAPASADVVAITPPVISGTPQVGQVLSSTNAVWSGGATTTGGWAWSRCTNNVDLSTCTLIPGLSWASHEYVVTSDDLGQYIRVSQYTIVFVGPPIYQYRADVASAPTAVVTNAPPPPPPTATKPSNTALPRIKGRADVNSKLTVSHGSWSGRPPITYKYQWKSCNAKGKQCKNIRGATKTTLRLSSKYIGHRLAVTVKASNSAGSAVATSKASVVVTR